jgi:methylated-DNA-[protein]-cysteine S-methyltransferase
MVGSLVTSAAYRYTTMPTPLGELLILGRDERVAGIFMPEHRNGPDPQPQWRRDDSAYASARTQLREYLGGERQEFDLELDLIGTPFQLRVWAQLLTIPYGATSTYGAVAQAIELPAAVRAVGTAVGRNPLSVIVPCHRVIGSTGALTGYAGGLDNKRWLLAHEIAGGTAAAPTAQLGNCRLRN